MSILDFTVSSGVCLNEYASEETIHEMDVRAVAPAQNRTDIWESPESIFNNWASRIRPIAQRVYDLQMNTNFGDMDAQRISALVSDTVNLAGIIASESAYINSVYTAYHSNMQQLIIAFIRPNIVQISANRAKIIRECGSKIHISRYYPRVADAYCCRRIAECITSMFSNGVSDTICSPRMICAAIVNNSDVIKIEDMSSFIEAVDYAIGIQNPAGVVYDIEPKTADAMSLLRWLIEDHDNGIIGSYTEGPVNKDIRFAYGAVSKYRVEIMNDIAYNGNAVIPDSVVQKVGKLAFTVVNMFSALFMDTYCKISDVANDAANVLAKKQYIDRAIQVCTAGNMPTS